MKKLTLMMMIAVLILIIVTSCAIAPKTYRGGWYDEEVQRLKIVQRAEDLIGVRNLRKIDSVYRNDCSGFVVGLYSSLGYKIMLNHPRGRYTLSQLLFINLRKRGLVYMSGDPRRGDLVFFRGTTRKMQNRVSHVGIVDDILKDHTVIIINYGSKGISKLKMNLLHPHLYKSKNGRILNDFIVKKNNSNVILRLLAAEHFSGYGNLYNFVKH